MKIVWTKPVTGRCARLEDVPLGAQIVSVNGREFKGMCRKCGRPVVQGQEYVWNTSGRYWHDRCPPVRVKKKYENPVDRYRERLSQNQYDEIVSLLKVGKMSIRDIAMTLRVSRYLVTAIKHHES